MNLIKIPERNVQNKNIGESFKGILRISGNINAADSNYIDSCHDFLSEFSVTASNSDYIKLKLPVSDSTGNMLNFSLGRTSSLIGNYDTQYKAALGFTHNSEANDAVLNVSKNGIIIDILNAESTSGLYLDSNDASLIIKHLGEPSIRTVYKAPYGVENHAALFINKERNKNNEVDYIVTPKIISTLNTDIKNEIPTGTIISQYSINKSNLEDHELVLEGYELCNGKLIEIELDNIEKIKKYLNLFYILGFYYQIKEEILIKTPNTKFSAGSGKKLDILYCLAMSLLLANNMLKEYYKNNSNQTFSDWLKNKEIPKEYIFNSPYDENDIDDNIKKIISSVYFKDNNFELIEKEIYKFSNTIPYYKNDTIEWIPIYKIPEIANLELLKDEISINFHLPDLKDKFIGSSPINLAEKIVDKNGNTVDMCSSNQTIVSNHISHVGLLPHSHLLARGTDYFTSNDSDIGYSTSDTYISITGKDEIAADAHFSDNNKNYVFQEVPHNKSSLHIINNGLMGKEYTIMTNDLPDETFKWYGRTSEARTDNDLSLMNIDQKDKNISFKPESIKLLAFIKL